MTDQLEQAPAPPARVVVLGGTGFVGQALVRHLAWLGISTVSLSTAEVDLTDPKSVSALHEAADDGDAVVFVSAITPDRGRDIRTLMKNLTMAEHVSAFLAQSACAQVVYVGSDAVYEDDATPVRETSCTSPSSFHGLMHLGRERMLAHVVRDSAMPLLVLRPSLLYGPDDTHNGYGPNRFLRTARQEGKITLFGNGEEKRDHVHVEDLVRLVGLGLLHRTEGTFNVATGESHSFFQVAQIIADNLDRKVDIECLPRQAPITHRHFDISRTRKAFPTFGYTRLETGLTEIIERDVGQPDV